MILFLDCETTTSNKGNPFDLTNSLVCVGWRVNGEAGIWYKGDDSSKLAKAIAAAKLVVAFNAKFDLHWLRKEGLLPTCPVYCVQLAEFFLNRQSPKYPSLDGVAASYGIDGKFDLVKKEYWDKEIDTDKIPRPILTDYCLQDIAATEKIYHLQQARITPKNKTLLSLQMQDLLVLEEIEYNGLYFNPNKVKAKEKELDTQISETQEKLDLYHNIPCFNWGSPAHVSALLYGGTIVEERRVPIGVFKTGEKVGQPRFAVEKVTHTLARMYKPPKGSELKKEGVWSTDEDTLLKIKGGKKELIEGILKSKELAKKQSTYVRGLLETHMKMHWPDNYLHGEYNQVVAATARLSSKRPNMQNMDGALLNIFESRFQ